MSEYFLRLLEGEYQYIFPKWNEWDGFARSSFTNPFRGTNVSIATATNSLILLALIPARFMA